MNYEERYNQALERAKKVHNGELTISPNEVNDFNVYEYIFPELKESEDERIRKAIICGMNALKEQHKETFASIPINDCIAWLEKQGEKSAEKIKHINRSYTTSNQEFFQWIYDRLVYVYNENPNVDYMVSLKERIEDMQNPFWREEDEKMRQDIISGLKAQIQSIYAHDEHGKAQMNNRIDWLKSIKPHWKPSEEQMEALKYFISFHEDHARSLTTKWEEFKNLESLYNDLKSL